MNQLDSRVTHSRPPSPARAPALPPGEASLEALPVRPGRSLTKLLLVDFRSGEAVHQHPDIVPFLQQGWQIRSAVPRLVESKGTRLLVVLNQLGRRKPLTADR